VTDEKIVLAPEGPDEGELAVPPAPIVIG